jgi:hypothetical protein
VAPSLRVGFRLIAEVLSKQVPADASSALTGTPRSPGRSGLFQLCRFTGIERRCCGDCAIAAGGHIVGEIDDADGGQT